MPRVHIASKLRSLFAFLRENSLLFLFLLAVFLWSFNELKEYDVWYHLKTGEYILDSFSIPKSDIFSYTAEGARWITHSWLAESIFALVHRLFGFPGLIAFVGLFSVCVYFLVYRLALRLGANKHIALFMLFLFPFFKTFSFFVPRPQIFSYLFVVLEILLLEGYLATKHRAYLLSLAVLMLFWANIHASVVLGMGILFAYAFFSRMLLFPAVAGSALALINPNTYKIFTYQFEIQEVAKALHVEEWISIWAYRNFFGTQILFLIMIAINIFFIISFLKEKSSRNLRMCGLVVGFSALPFVSVRHLAFFPLVALPILAAQINGLPSVRSMLQKISQGLASATLLGIGVLYAISGYMRLPAYYVNEQTLPVRAVDFIARSGIRGPLFNMYHDGGYLIWRLWPGEKVFFDGRSEVYRGAPLDDLLTISRQGIGWDGLIDKKYRINYFLLSYRPPYTEFSLQMARAVLGRGFKVVYLDETHMILLRNSRENMEIIGKFAIDIGGVVK